MSNWKIDGAGPIPFPFAFYSGVNQPFVMAYTGIAGSGILIVLLILLTATRWRHWSAGIVQAILLGSLAIANEISFLLIGMGFVIAAAAWMVHHRAWRMPKQLAVWLVVMGGAVRHRHGAGGHADRDRRRHRETARLPQQPTLTRHRFWCGHLPSSRRIWARCRSSIPGNWRAGCLRSVQSCW